MSLDQAEPPVRRAWTKLWSNAVLVHALLGPRGRTNVGLSSTDLPGVAEVLDIDGKSRHGLDHARSGELVLVAAPEAWFTYYYWIDDRFPEARDPHTRKSADPGQKTNAALPADC